jgi:hypothetical protein
MSSQQSKELAAVRKFVWGLAYPDEDERHEAPDDVFVAVDTALNRVEELVEENRLLRRRVDELEGELQMALDAAGAVESGARADGGPKKIEIARWKSRNELIRQAGERPDLRNPATGAVVQNKSATVDVSKVQDMATPEHDLKWQTVVDAWKSLARNWDCFEVVKPDDGRKQLRIVKDPPESLVRMVETDLDRDDLIKRLVDGRE